MQLRDPAYAKPSYSTLTGSISWMIPLHINRELIEEPELVLVLRKAGEFYEIKTIIPYDDETNSAFHDYDKNEHREHTREGDYHDAFAFESSALLLVDEMANPARICESKFTLACIFKKLRALPDNEGSRIYKRYVIGYTAREIAQQEGVSHWSVRASIVRAKPKVHDIFVELGVAA